MQAQVTLIAQTITLPMQMEDSTGSEWSYPYNARHSDGLSEFAGRACYQAWDRPNPATRENHDYLANIIAQGHESVFGHASFTFYITGISRNCTHEMIRHRFLAFSEMSQRYVHSDKFPVSVKPPAFEGNDQLNNEMLDFNVLAKILYRKAVAALELKGHTRKRAREAARAYLPGASETRIVVTGNVRAWRDFLKQRLSPAADAEIQLVAREIGRLLKLQAPNSFQDIELVGEE